MGNNDICSHLFGIISSYCLAENLNKRFMVKWFRSDKDEDILSINLRNKYTLNTSLPHLKEYLIPDYELASLLEENDVVKLWMNKSICIKSCHNMYQHFCVNRPNYRYKSYLLDILTKLPKIINIKRTVYDLIPKNIGQVVGIHICRGKYTDEESVKDILHKINIDLKTNPETKSNHVLVVSDYREDIKLAESILEKVTIIPCFHDNLKTLTITVNMISLSKCKSLYIKWFDDFSRLSAILNPYRSFFTFEHPNYFMCRYKCPIDELLSYYNRMK